MVPQHTSRQSAKWVTRALELAAARQMLHSARYVSMRRHPDTGELHTLTVTVGSQTIAGDTHTVIYDADEATAHCDCLAGSYGKPCCHAGAAIQYGIYVAKLYTREGQAQAARDAARDLAHQGNDHALHFSII